MEKFLQEYPVQRLVKEIRNYSETIEFSPQKSPNYPHLSQDQAARIIQAAWREKKVKDAMNQAPFHSYRSMIKANDKQSQLSAMMFGHHVAEQLHDAKEQIANPLVSTVEYYHRSTTLDNPIVDALFKEFEIVNLDKKKYSYIPISLLNNNPIEDVLTLFSTPADLQLIKKHPFTIAILVIPTSDEVLHTKLKDKIKNMGLVASSWEIAENIRSTVLNIPTKNHKKIELDPKLPATKVELLTSELMVKLKALSGREKHYPTGLLIQALKKLISDLPPNIGSSAIQRIATMINFSNTFYLYHYPRYALCIYYVLHEISLALIENKDPVFLEQEYQRYKKESLTTLEKTIGLDEANLSESRFLATPSTSGASACSAAMRIASKMITQDNSKPKVKIFKPCYYELPNTFNLTSTEDANEADVLMISAGPIVNPEGLTPGIDINLFVKHHVIDSTRTKPVTLIVDATTALYKNLRLNNEVQQLIAKGKLSIIVHESHQKFGLIHSDQAQYGRVFGWCSKKHFSKKTFDKVEANSKADFFNHSDIRIGAFVNTRCGDTLEKIKIKHFTNGALLRNLLLGTSIISAHIERHEDMQTNLDELYFLTNQETSKDSFVSNMEFAAYGVVEYRNSFGHFSLTTADAAGLRRLSADASDTLDNLVLASHMRLSRIYDHSALKMFDALLKSQKTIAKLNLEEQIVLTGLLHCISSFFPLIPDDFDQVEFIDRALKEADKNKLITPDNSPKNIIISKSNGITYLGFHSHGKVVRQLALKDPVLLKELESGTINSPNARILLKNHLKKLQKSYMPADASLPLLYTLMSNMPNSCPLLNKRSAFMDINRWLDALQTRLIAEYKPENPRQFMKGVKELHSNNFNKESINYGLVFLSHISSSFRYSSSVFYKQDFIQAIKKVYEGNQQILENLKTTPQKHKAAQQSSRQYLSNCFEALHQFYSQEKPVRLHHEDLVKSIEHAEADYLNVLAKDRSQLSQVIRYILKAITNFIASLSLGVAHYINYKATGEVLFFSGTRSENTLKQLNNNLIKNTEPSSLNGSIS